MCKKKNPNFCSFVKYRGVCCSGRYYLRHLFFLIFIYFYVIKYTKNIVPYKYYFVFWCEYYDKNLVSTPMDS